MKRFLLRSTVFLLTFVLTLMAASHFINKDHDSMTGSMRDASLPVVSMLCADRNYNRLFGYTKAQETAFFREELTILGENRETGFVVDTYGRQVTGIGAEIRSIDGNRLIENIEITGYREEDGQIPVTLSLKDLIEKQEEYMLVLFLELDNWQQVRYYSRIIWNPDSHLRENLNFVLDFHEKLYHREEAKELVRYLETNSRLEDNSSFHKVNIHSSFKQITWGDMKVTELAKPSVSLKELNSQSAQIVLDYFVSVAGEKDATYYRMKEYFRVRYTSDRMYLLDYERTMTQIPDESDLYAGDKILLGIADENVAMKENESGNVLAFCQANRLFAYDVENQKLALLFSFYDADHQDARDTHDSHSIKILDVDEEGNVDFAVYGYMNRGMHEGENGILVEHFDVDRNVLEEIVYIPWTKSAAVLEQQLSRLCYKNKNGILYLFAEQAVYRIDLQEKVYAKLFDVTEDEAYMVSADHRILVWEEKEDQEMTALIKIRDLESDTQASVYGKYGETLKILGFMGQDIIYGAARKEDVERQSSGALFFPMYRLCISKADGTPTKEYQQENICVTDCSVEENQITLERVMRKENGEFVATSQDHITRTIQESGTKNRIAVVDIDLYKRYVQIQVSGKIDAELVQLLTPREILHEGKDDFPLEASAAEEQYYVYGPYGVENIFLSAGAAIECAYTEAGTVTGEDGRILWQKGNRSSRNQIMAIKEPEKVSEREEPERESLAVCLDTLLRFKGISVESREMLDKGLYPLEILQNNLTDVSVIDASGCSLDAMLYYVNRDIPVLAVLQSGEGVLITGFNESQVVIYQPLAGKLYKKSMSESARWFEENGNCFLTYFP